MVSRRNLLAFICTGATASLSAWLIVGENPPVSLDVDDAAPDVDIPNPTVTNPRSPAIAESEPEIELSRAAEMLIKRVNELRTARRGLSALDESACVKQKAQSHAEDMAENNYFAHTSLDGTTQIERYSSCGDFGGENIAKTYLDTRLEMADGEILVIETTEDLAHGLMAQWLNSRLHRERGIYGDWTGINIGLSRSGSNVYAVMGFKR